MLGCAVNVFLLLFQAGKQWYPLPPRFLACTGLWLRLCLVWRVILAAVFTAGSTWLLSFWFPEDDWAGETFTSM
jgi:hypothetical protein